jgi:hypothetical protein
VIEPPGLALMVLFLVLGLFAVGVTLEFGSRD